MLDKIKKLAGLAGLSLVFISSAAHAGVAEDAIAQAEADLQAAEKAGALWRLLDPATGGRAAPLGKLIKAAKAKLEANDEAEAIRIAQKVSWAAQTGISQAAGQKNAAPFY